MESKEQKRIWREREMNLRISRGRKLLVSLAHLAENELEKDIKIDAFCVKIVTFGLTRHTL
jgi:hypothetical protein